MFTKSDILKDLYILDIPKDSIVTVHTSLKAVGEIEGGGEALLEALIEAFAQGDGVLAIPTHTWDSDVYDRRNNDSCIGTLPRLAAGHINAVRTLHPTHSMAVFGNKERVVKFVENEAIADTPANPNGCYGKLLKENGYILLIGVGQDKNTFIHCVEEMMKVPNRLTKNKVKKTIVYKDGSREERELLWFDDTLVDDVSVNFPKFEAPFRYHNCIRDGKVGNAKVQICSSKGIKDTLELIYKRNNFQELLSDDKPLSKKLYEE